MGKLKFAIVMAFSSKKGLTQQQKMESKQLD